MIIESTLQRACSRLVDIRDALAELAAHGTAGNAKPMLQAAARLQAAVDGAEPACRQVQRLMRHLHVAAMPEAATVLCDGGRLKASRTMMDLYALTCATATGQAEVGAFLEECTGALEATHTATSRQRQGGRLLGSA